MGFRVWGSGSTVLKKFETLENRMGKDNGT